MTRGEKNTIFYSGLSDFYNGQIDSFPESVLAEIAKKYDVGEVLPVVLSKRYSWDPGDVVVVFNYGQDTRILTQDHERTPLVVVVDRPGSLGTAVCGTFASTTSLFAKPWVADLRIEVDPKSSCPTKTPEPVTIRTDSLDDTRHAVWDVLARDPAPVSFCEDTEDPDVRDKMLPFLRLLNDPAVSDIVWGVRPVFLASVVIRKSVLICLVVHCDPAKVPAIAAAVEFYRAFFPYLTIHLRDGEIRISSSTPGSSGRSACFSLVCGPRVDLLPIEFSSSFPPADILKDWSRRMVCYQDPFSLDGSALPTMVAGNVQPLYVDEDIYSDATELVESDHPPTTLDATKCGEVFIQLYMSRLALRRGWQSYTYRMFMSSVDVYEGK